LCNGEWSCADISYERHRQEITPVLEKLLRARTAATVVVALMTTAGVAVAATSTGDRPTFAQEETSTSVGDTTTSVDDSTTTSVDDSTTTTESPTTTEAPTTTVAPSTSTTAGTGSGEFKNHGACVSAAAHDTPPGPGHGQAVSEVAKSDCGKQNAGGEDEAPEAGSSEDQGGPGNSNGKGKGHNK
jgi:hypothetical protein